MAEMGLREFGRMVDKTSEAVRKAIATGKIPSDCLGKRALSSGRLVPVITDPERAWKNWQGNIDPIQVRDKAALSAGRAAAHARDRGEHPPADAEGTGIKAGSRVPSITESKAITEDYKARMAKLEFEERTGKVVNAEDVKVRVVTMITVAKTKLLGVPSKAKGRIPSLTVRDVEELEQLISEALEELSVA